ncbi:MAG: PKD domain-containing protein [Cytophagales bacterium]|nr:MAG: PKD domain-containing protein [Cytophagales bacterium]
MLHLLRPCSLALAFICLTVSTLSWAQSGTPSLNRVLVFSKTKGYRHASIPVGQRTLMQMGKENGFSVDTTENSALFNEANLKRYGLVLFLSTTGDVLNDAQQAAFERYIQAGGGYLGIHAATDTEYGWPWYNKLAGGQFMSHPGNPNVQTGEAYSADKASATMFGFPDRWKIKDEFYDFKNFNRDVKVIAKLDESTYKEGKMGADHPAMWYHEYDGGRAFYTVFGHPDETYSEPIFLKTLLAGVKWAMAKQLKYGAAKTMAFPEENRFEQKVLAEKLDEPTELVVLNSGKVLFGERKGALKVYNPKTNTTKVVTNMPVYTKFEYGLMGVNVDPKFAENKWLYLFYSPVSNAANGDTAQHLSRFKYNDATDEIDLKSEQVLLRVPVKRTDCCHTGGSIAWDKQGNLYLSTGDDVNPFASNGFGPMDERPGRKGWDGQASSANTNDFRGKILRIKPDPTAARYTIPEGNLFGNSNPAKAKPEIYVMGNRNPYRISVDQRTGFLYWGEVGPDAADNVEKRGPRGHDEVNQARKAGNFGWPMFVADNRAYRDYNFADSTSGPAHDAAKPINNSPNNTGLTELPPAQKAFIYYPYADSPEFGEIVGKGSRNAMGGPVYYYDDYPENAVKFPRHFDGKFFAYDWTRDWINPVTMTQDGDFVKMERFLPATKFSHPIDMQFANDGSLYVLEYGQKWFAQNDDARLTRITYNAGNRRPVAMASASKMIGAAPLKVAFTGNRSVDYDGDALKYEWTFGKSLPKSTEANPTFTYTKPGVYQAVLKITDAAGKIDTRTMDIKVGNDEPTVALAVKGNKTFYFEGKPVEYEVEVDDKEDGSLKAGKISPDDVTMTINYLEGFDKTMLAQGHQANTGFSTGKRLIELSDCKSCHVMDEASIGPSYMDVAKKYAKDNSAVAKLSRKIIAGGGGVWGEQAMSAHPQLKKEEAEDMVRYILALGDTKAMKREPVKGAYVAAPQKKAGSYLLSASYTDKGNGVAGPLTASTSMALRSPRMKAVQYDANRDIMKFELPGTKTEAAIPTTSGSFIQFNDIDLSGISAVKVMAIAADERLSGGKIEVRIGSPRGQLLGEADVKAGSMGNVSIPLSKIPDGLQKVFFVFVNPDNKQKPLMAVDTVEFVGAGM